MLKNVYSISNYEVFFFLHRACGKRISNNKAQCHYWLQATLRWLYPYTWLEMKPQYRNKILKKNFCHRFVCLKELIKKIRMWVPLIEPVESELGPVDKLAVGPWLTSQVSWTSSEFITFRQAHLLSKSQSNTFWQAVLSKLTSSIAKFLVLSK